MSEAFVLDRDTRTLRMSGELTIYQAVAAKDALLEALAFSPSLQIDLAEVSEIDTAGVQLLLLAKREAARLGGEATLINHSSSVLDVINLLNVGAALGDPMLLPSQR